MREARLNNQQLADLHWLAFLLTGQRERSVELAAADAAGCEHANPFFETWMAAWSRRVVMAKALTAVSGEMAASARRTERKGIHRMELPARDWSMDRGTTKADLETAIVAIDDFPRAAIVLSIFEGVAVQDAAVLLDCDPDLVKKAIAIGLGELTANLARAQGWTSKSTVSPVIHTEVQYA